MARIPDGQTPAEHFGEQYRVRRSPVMRELERVVCGCDYGGTSWTTRAEAEQVGRLLDLRPGKRLLELGAGSGWPGLFLARTTGCAVTLVDVPLEAIRIAAERAAADQLDDTCAAAVADGAVLPFRDNAFDAISHADVLCCLDAKSAVLRACRQVVRKGGRMVFSVISIAPGLSSTDHERAVEAGPPFVETALNYPTLLRQTGWTITDCVDLTDEYAQTHRRLLREQGARAAELSQVLGTAELSAWRVAKRATTDAIEAGLLRRELFVVDAVIPEERGKHSA
ncbi:MAG: class I SAM-dependent methyltransferase [Acidiferrobacterales bacterium]|nr:class I SAM-dependent methyltransferase [Acidiferrobacterales bacterium]